MVNGWTVIVPANMLVTFPNAFIPWPEFVAQKDKFIGFEVNVSGYRLVFLGSFCL